MNDAYHEHEDRELIAEHEAHPERFAKVGPPPCDNCGQPAKLVGDHPEAGHGYVCDDCWRGQGFKNLKPWDYWRQA